MGYLIRGFWHWLCEGWTDPPAVEPQPEPEIERMDPDAVKYIAAVYHIGEPGQALDVRPRAVCQYCGGLHRIACPRLKRVKFRDGFHTPEEVEYWADGEWSREHIIFLHDVIDDLEALEAEATGSN